MNTQAWHILIDFELDSTTIRVADQQLVLSDNTVYKGWLLSSTPLRRTIGPILNPRLVSPSMQLVVDNKNSQMMDLIDTYQFDNRDVVFKQGYGVTAGNYAETFTGIVQQGGIQSDDELVWIQIDAVFVANDRNIPIMKFFPSVYPNMEDRAKFVPIPIPYGDWRTTAGDGEKVPCYQIDSTVGTGGKWKIANRAIKQIEAVYKNGGSESISSVDLTNAEFVLDVAYDPTVDVVNANIRGVVDGSSNLIEDIPDVFDDTLQTYMGVAAANIDSTALTAWQSYLTANDVVRRVIVSEALASTYLSELLVEGFADVVLIGGKYTPIYRIASVDAGIPTYRAFDIVDDRTKKRIRSLKDPERVFANEIVAQYQYDPISAAYKKTYESEDSASIERFKSRVRRRLYMNWLYLPTGVEARADREILVFASEVEGIDVEMHPVARTLGPTNQFRLVYGRYDLGGEIGTPFQIRTSYHYPNNAYTKFTAWNMMQMSPGRWTSDSAPAWGSASAWQKNTQGFWTTANGYADATETDETSKRSFWF